VRGSRTAAWGASALIVLAGTAWLASPRSFIAEDSYFYLVAARRLALDGEHGFSGIFPSNGFHPLWLYGLSTWSWLVSTVHAGALWYAGHAVPLSLAMTATAAHQLVTLERLLRVVPGTLAYPPLLFVTVLGVLYSEAHVLLASLAWLARRIVLETRAGRPRPALFGLVAAVVTLARLDSVFLAAAALVWSAGHWRSLRASAAACSVYLLAVGAYVGANLWWFGGLPISGWLKSSFPTPTPAGFQGGGLLLSLSEYSVPYGVLPIGAGTAAWLALRRTHEMAPVLLVLLCGSVMHMGYTMLFAAYCGWNWYYVLPILTGSLGVALLLGRRGGERVAGLSRAAIAAALAIGALGLLYKVRHDDRTEAMRAIQEYLAAPEVAGRTEFVSELPGAGAIAGSANVIAADMLTANRRLYDQLQRAPDPWGLLLSLCRARGKPLHAIVYVGGDFVSWDEDRGLLWIDPKVSTRRPLGTIRTGAPVIARPEIPFLVWRAPDR
jgi:hypothetical protein